VCILNTVTPYEIIDLVKSSNVFDGKGKDINVSVNELISLNHNIHPDELVSVLTEIPDVKISDKGFIIPRNYFK
jgi:hypothetical protein